MDGRKGSVRGFGKWHPTPSEVPAGLKHSTAVASVLGRANMNYPPIAQVGCMCGFSPRGPPAATSLF